MTNKNEIASSKGCGIKNVCMSEPLLFLLSHKQNESFKNLISKHQILKQ